MKDVIKLLTPYYFMMLLYRLSLKHDERKLDRLGDEQGYVHHNHESDLYEYVSGDDKLRIRVLREDIDYYHMYILKSFQQKILDFYTVSEITEQLVGIVREITINPYCDATDIYPETIKINSTGTKYTVGNKPEDFAEFFKYHISLRKNGILVKEQDIPEWLEHYGLKILQATDKRMYISNPWTEKFVIFLEYEPEDDNYRVVIHDTVNSTWYYTGNDFADRWIAWLTNRNRCFK